MDADSVPAKGTRIMTLRWLIVLTGAVLMTIGAIGLLTPVSATDSSGQSVGCGTALVSDLSRARAENEKTVADLPIINQMVPHTDYVAECEAALSGRRTWTIPLAVIGAVVIAGVLVAPVLLRGPSSAT